MNSQIIPAALGLLVLLSMQFVESLPINRRMSRAVTPSDTVSMSRSIWELLIDIDVYLESSKGLPQVINNATALKNSSNFKPETQCLERKVCMGRVFTNSVSCDDGSQSSLTYAQLTEYYNEFVLQLKLAEHNLKVAINLEIKEGHINESLKQEREIITLLNESILPALEYTLNITQMKTNCSATAVIADWMISLYSNCVAVQSSNEFLHQTAWSLFDVLDFNEATQNPPPIGITNDNIELKVDEHKEWCIVQ